MMSTGYPFEMADWEACARFIRDVMERKKLKQLDVGRRLGHRRNGMVRSVSLAKRAMPLDDVEQWVKALELSEEDARAFRRLAIRSYAPEYVQQLVDKIDRLEAKVKAFEADDDER